MPRSQALRAWLDEIFPGQQIDLAPASADASFRRYFRLTLPDGTTRIVMDAPPEHEDCRPFVQVAQEFAQAGVHVPAVLQQNLAAGFLLLTDLGSTTYLDALSARPESADELYRAANAALLKVQLASRAGALPEYDAALLQREMELFPTWYLDRHLGLALDAKAEASLRGVFAKLLANNLAQPRVFVHRDYHSRNLMLTSPNPGVLDFQDAVYGPITYDLVSLYRDAYVTWPEESELDWTIRYWEAARLAGLPVAADFDVFWRDYEWMGAQRQLKVLGIFARLNYRDGKAQYLADMPRVLAYLRRTAARYRDLAPLLPLLDAAEGAAPQVGYTF